MCLRGKVNLALYDTLKKGNLSDWDRIFEDVGKERMVEITENINEHPDDYESACYCKECQSCL